MAEEDSLPSAQSNRMDLEPGSEVSIGTRSVQDGSGTSHGGLTTLSAQLPPGKQKTADEVLAEMKKVPLFMNSLDDLDEDNEQLQALRALAYEGTRAEIGQNFREQGNDCVKQKQYPNARDFYTKALLALRGPVQPRDPREEPVVVDEEAEEKLERAIEEACCANRALCNLEMSITTSSMATTRVATDVRHRKLWSVPTRLRGSVAAQRTKYQSVVQSSICLFRTRQSSRSTGCMSTWS